jgi:hypothetical protein
VSRPSFMLIISENSTSATFVNKGRKRKGRSCY